MKKIALTIGLILTVLMGNAQLNKLSLGIASSADYYSYQRKTTGVLQINPTAISAFHIGLRAEYEINDKLSIISGLYYSENKYNINLGGINPYDTIIINGPYSYKIKAIEIPLLFSYTIFSKGRCKISSAVGLVETILSESNNSKTTDYRFSTQLNLMFNYLISKHIFITLEPFLNINISQTNKIPVYKNNNYIGGLLSLNYKF